VLILRDILILLLRSQKRKTFDYNAENI